MMHGEGVLAGPSSKRTAHGVSWGEQGVLGPLGAFLLHPVLA